MAVNPYFVFKQKSAEPVQLMRYDDAEMELRETFFAKGHAMLTDEFGTKWQLSCPDA
ncbi:MAG TPA: hypothetical protein H9891_04465 [Candidatus Salinicoccus stercoripullorum]|uniref:Uncharacterized protein n=1 Tax=Candidatus Salinicoccus stercoripullorum TaxID=2838756 RepID=A0A9D1U0L3_9STAP|nr:hypothetical protein [Candidatus Salinicoccus stercoripullorum]